jgi:hypothetical protein
VEIGDGAAGEPRRPEQVEQQRPSQRGTPVRPVASPLEADRPHTCSTAAATGEFIK